MPTVITPCGGGGGGGGITEITSADGSVTVSNPTGPIVDLSAAVSQYIVFKGNSLGVADNCVWDTSPWAASTSIVATVDTLDHRKLLVQAGVYVATFNLNSNANFALYYTGAPDMSDILSADVEGSVSVPQTMITGATWLGSNDGFNRDVGAINFPFPFRAAFGTNELRIGMTYERALGFVAPTFSLTLVKVG